MHSCIPFSQCCSSICQRITVYFGAILARSHRGYVKLPALLCTTRIGFVGLFQVLNVGMIVLWHAHMRPSTRVHKVFVVLLFQKEILYLHTVTTCIGVELNKRGHVCLNSPTTCSSHQPPFAAGNRPHAGNTKERDITGASPQNYSNGLCFTTTATIGELGISNYNYQLTKGDVQFAAATP